MKKYYFRGTKPKIVPRDKKTQFINFTYNSYSKFQIIARNLIDSIVTHTTLLRQHGVNEVPRN